MRQVWQERRFRYLLNIIEGLPEASHTGQAHADDPNLARQPTSGPARRWRPTVRHHDETAVLLRAIHTSIEKLVAVEAGNKYKPDFIPGPLVSRGRPAITDAESAAAYQRLAGMLGFGPN